ncbi:hypothetical protein [Aliikangiella sp. IMCC44359]|uniref:hypothetical protein n=1 Tax=Aliikangiella sp. IMCC44359 TaxID=3459125 RepID=UPI00403B2999
MQERLNQILASVLLITLIACGGPNKALISSAEIDAAQRSGNLQNLYQKVSGIINESSGSTKKEAVATRSKIAQLLVKDKSNKVDQLLTQFNQNNNSVSRQQLLALQASIAPMNEWSATDYARISPKIEQAIKQLNQMINAAVSESKEEGKDRVASVMALKRAANLAGESQPEYASYQEANEKLLTVLQSEGNEGLANRMFNTAIVSAKGGLMLDPGNIQFESMLSQAQAGQFEKDFRFALESGKPESAYQAMMNVADKPIFLQLKKSMHNSIILLANYFAASAQKAYKNGNLLTAYNNFVKGRDIQDKLGISEKGFIQEKKYLDLLMTKFKKENLGLGNKQILLRTISEFDSNYPGLKTELRKINESVKDRAMTKLSVADFKEIPSQNTVVASMGRRIGRKLEKILFEKLGNELLIVTEVKGTEANAYDGLILQIDGEILQAAIETSQNTGKRSQNVQVGVNRVETEDYQKWSKRKRGEAPKQYLETPINEDVVLSVEHISKQAIAEVAFRIIEPANGSILLTDNFVKENEFSGESINELQKGDFHQPYVKADLPSDIKIMDELASVLASNLGDKLAEYLQNPEQVFYQKSLEVNAQGNKSSSVELLANAIVIAEGKGRDVKAWYELAKSQVLE